MAPFLQQDIRIAMGQPSDCYVPPILLLFERELVEVFPSLEGAGQKITYPSSSQGSGSRELHPDLSWASSQMPWLDATFGDAAIKWAHFTWGRGVNSCGLRAGCDRMTMLMTPTCHPSLPLLVYSYTDSGQWDKLVPSSLPKCLHISVLFMLFCDQHREILSLVCQHAWASTHGREQCHPSQGHSRPASLQPTHQLSTDTWTSPAGASRAWLTLAELSNQ